MVMIVTVRMLIVIRMVVMFVVVAVVMTTRPAVRMFVMGVAALGLAAMCVITVLMPMPCAGMWLGRSGMANADRKSVV